MLEDVEAEVAVDEATARRFFPNWPLTYKQKMFLVRRAARKREIDNKNKNKQKRKETNHG